MSKTIAAKASAQNLFVLDLYNKEWNKVIDETAVKNLIITTELIEAGDDLCVTDVGESKNSNVFSSNTVNVNKCYYLVNGNIFNFAASKRDEDAAFPVQIIDACKKGSSYKMNIDKTHIEPLNQHL